jgi:hypothetical protein
LSNEKFVLCPCQLALTGPAEVEDWEALGVRLCNLQRGILWWIGDMAVMGEANLGDDIYQAFDETMSVDLIQRCAKVCREFPPSRRNATLSFTHHAMLLGMPAEIQQALLGMAETNQWDTAEMRRQVTRLKNS